MPYNPRFTHDIEFWVKENTSDAFWIPIGSISAAGKHARKAGSTTFKFKGESRIRKVKTEIDSGTLDLSVGYDPADSANGTLLDTLFNRTCGLSSFCYSVPANCNVEGSVKYYKYGDGWLMGYDINLDDGLMVADLTIDYDSAITTNTTAPSVDD